MKNKKIVYGILGVLIILGFSLFCYFHIKNKRTIFDYSLERYSSKEINIEILDAKAKEPVPNIFIHFTEFPLCSLNAPCPPLTTGEGWTNEEGKTNIKVYFEDYSTSVRATINSDDLGGIDYESLSHAENQNYLPVRIWIPLDQQKLKVYIFKRDDVSQFFPLMTAEELNEQQRYFGELLEKFKKSSNCYWIFPLLPLKASPTILGEVVVAISQACETFNPYTHSVYHFYFLIEPFTNTIKDFYEQEKSYMANFELEEKRNWIFPERLLIRKGANE